MSSTDPNRSLKSYILFAPPNIQLMVLLGAAIALRLAWLVYTNYTYEDAFITFRYARNLVSGHGFVFNVGERIYGTTTPLFTLLLAGWLIVFPENVILGARGFDLLAALGSLTLVWVLLSELEIKTPLRIAVLLLLAISDKLWERDTGGMETPLVIFLMIAALYAVAQNKSLVAGIIAGMLLWTRIDTAIWVAVLIFVAWYVNRRPSIRLILTVGLTYLPWLAFATLYFGSSIPYTVTAKWTAYQLGSNPTPWLDRLLVVLKWVTPVSIPIEWSSGQLIVGTITIALAVYGAFAVRRSTILMVLPVFGLLELVSLVSVGAVFEPRYFVPLYWTILLLVGLGLGTIWRRGFSTVIGQRVIAGLLFVTGLFGFWLIIQRAHYIRDYQLHVYDSSLKPLGLWLNEHTPPNATVLLEPLGYAGFYANRYMIDEVGLVSPQVVALKRQGVKDKLTLILLLKPDYAVVHCDDIFYRLEKADSIAADFAFRYQWMVTFNPLNFTPQSSSPEDSNQFRIQRNACYEVWQLHR